MLRVAALLDELLGSLVCLPNLVQFVVVLMSLTEVLTQAALAPVDVNHGRPPILFL